ncbi:glutamate synthase [Acidithiobacillus albertensis]|uniref:GltB/FmdC/FwdC-like GXGXG domain-containing protein n=1 Tax=Acidithiobacillus albertensis TaxID=119978 RepID=UPI000B339DA2|nr:glutamate synthase [Acidithiobacillus albertensis]
MGSMNSSYEIEVKNRSIKDINAEIQQLAKPNSNLRITSTLSRHNLGIGLPPGVTINFEGSVGYYCGGLNTGATVNIKGEAGWGVGEGMSAGHITVDGYAGMSAGAAMRGGLIHIKGDAGPRIGVAMKGGNIVVEGKIGSQAGFMAHAGKIIVLGGAGVSCADALWQGELWVAGNIEGMGVDAQVVEPTAEQIKEVDEILAPLGLADASRNWRRIISGRRLWYFESREANAWLMI